MFAMHILQTQRLYLREITEADAENAYLLNLDPEVLKYTGDVAFNSMEEARTFLKNYDHYKKYQFGRWAVMTKNEHQFLGWCGLKYTEDLNEHDIGFRLFKKFWNRGYATEAAKACVKMSFEKYQLS
jgi:[ribosomal protein S5]-alanine N-acetyltransferase